ncbi:Nucleoside diphosphate kinase [bacterium HR17]|uniref:Nucleoside diphosphate kinase n=1 Tax=Candidatus Fervidibacter japonicus TaxID=2035412 RepID=A0A2H5X8M2_9BACT|nr:Nucleoside diphosphate kinase [bacterium HR17]
MALERTFVMIKPDGVQRGLVGEIIQRLERKGLKLIGLKMLHLDRALAERHYEMHKGKAFFDELIAFITSGPVVAMVWEGENAIALVRTLMGALEPTEATPGSIRGDFACTKTMNIVHGSDSPENAQRETRLFFRDDELMEYRRCDEVWVRGNAD